jgi:hypothetical protein
VIARGHEFLSRRLPWAWFQALFVPAQRPPGPPRQRIESALAHPQRASVSLQRAPVEVALGAGEVIVALGFGDLLCSADRAAVEVHQVLVRRRVRKDHAAAAPVARWVRPGARRRRAHAQLRRQRQGDAALAQVRGAAAARQGGLEGGERRRQVATRGGGRARSRPYGASPAPAAVLVCRTWRRKRRASRFAVRQASSPWRSKS